MNCDYEIMWHVGVSVFSHETSEQHKKPNKALTRLNYCIYAHVLETLVKIAQAGPNCFDKQKADMLKPSQRNIMNKL